MAFSQTTESPLGADPAVNVPGLEETPTAESILDPVLTLLSDFRAYVVPAHSGVCPEPSAMVFGYQIVLNYHCKVLAPIYEDFAVFMLSVWVLAAFFIILSA